MGNMGRPRARAFWEDALVRAIRTMAQSAAATIGAGAAMSDVDWLRAASVAATAGILSVLMSLDRLGAVQAQGAGGAIGTTPDAPQIPAAPDGGGDDGGV